MVKRAEHLINLTRLFYRCEHRNCSWEGGIILRTTDGGNAWNSQVSGTANLLFGVSFANANTGAAVGAEGTILKTTNGGTNWDTQISGTTNFLFGVSFSDANTGIAVGASGTILRTTNGGTSWDTQTSGTTASSRSRVSKCEHRHSGWE